MVILRRVTLVTWRKPSVAFTVDYEQKELQGRSPHGDACRKDEIGYGDSGKEL